MKDAKMLVGPLGTIISEIGSGYVDHAILWDARERGFLVVTHAPDLENNNLTFAELYIAEDGDSFVHRETKRTRLKNDTVKMTNRKAKLVITFTGHGTGVFPRPTEVEDWVIADMWQEAGVPTPEPELPTPCVPPGNRKYFKPNKGVTRGQVAKMIAIATGRADPGNPNPPDTQTFEDVEVGSTFHEFVEVLAADSVMGGYDCTPE